MMPDKPKLEDLAPRNGRLVSWYGSFYLYQLVNNSFILVDTSPGEAFDPEPLDTILDRHPGFGDIAHIIEPDLHKPIGIRFKELKKEWDRSRHIKS
jgi:hypothetical protein